jgi:hypothetical protein
LILAAILLIIGCFGYFCVKMGREESRRYSCNSNLTQIAKACITYQADNGGFFPAFMQGCIEGQSNPNIPKSGQGSDSTFQPMPSLAVLYPQYIDNAKVFGCPSTSDEPLIALRYYSGARHTCFGFDSGPDQTGRIKDNRDPAGFAGAEVSGHSKCSYFYDELTNPRKMKPDQAIACDADGQTWFTAEGKNPPPYPSKGWSRKPRKPNHSIGQNVIYFDGQVKWTETVYASSDPNDNIFCPNSTNGVQWDADTDAYLWDGVDSRAVQNSVK